MSRGEPRDPRWEGCSGQKELCVICRELVQTLSCNPNMTKQNENFIVSDNWKVQSGESGVEDIGHLVLSSGSGLFPRPASLYL